jgi:2-polyprenyl-3-methyl-5-hydroxy-6-metoxy-1,4-benzoquinol methylase
MRDYVEYNSKAWDKQVENGNCWTVPVSKEIIEKARNGEWSILVSPSKPILMEWFPPLQGRRVLCLASGGGQQGPILAAAGACVTVFDNSSKQLEQDRFVSKRDSLLIETELGDMRDLSRFGNKYFDLIIANGIGCVGEIRKVWKETFRILKYNGIMISGGSNPIEYVFDLREWNKGKLIPRHKIPYSDIFDPTDEEKNELLISKNEPFFFGHSLQDQIQGQIEAGFLITGYYDDQTIGDDPLSKYLPLFFGVRASKFI